MVSLEILNDIAYVTLNRPDKQNALSVEMFIQLDQCIKKIKKPFNDNWFWLSFEYPRC